MTPTTMTAPAGVQDVAARIHAIRSRIDDVVGPPARAGFTLPSSTGAVSSIATTGDGSRAAPSGGVTPAWAAGLPEAARPWQSEIERAARSVGLDPTLLASVVQHESGFDQDVVSSAGAIGLAQLMPGTAEGLGVDPHDPVENLEGGARYLKAQLDRFGAVDLALAAYNAGPTRVVDAGGVPHIPETLAYVDRVTSTWERWS